MRCFESDGLWGFISNTDSIQIPPTYLFAQDFLPTGIAAVLDSSGWFYIDTLGNRLLAPYIFDNGPDYFSENLARFVVDGKVGFFNQQGKIVISAQFDFATPFLNGVAKVSQGCEFIKTGEHTEVTGGKWGIIDTSGNFLLPIQFDRNKINEQSLRKANARSKQNALPDKKAGRK
ncbi:WG repeat-containing protein [Chloroherpeton thalassium]|uniref:WG repeat-containing protein n=1 Tax=Chloroherpeton thalassium TaxID=100716 RepID=UPI001B7F7BD7|nr:WG repeat-containing protein [Chloroherpeton thalassium]